MKILFYISTICGGGAARVMVNVANGMIEIGNKVCFVTNFPADHEYTLDDRIKRISLEKSENTSGTIYKNLSRISKLRRVLWEECPDISISFMGENNFRLLLAARGVKTKTIVSVRNDPEKEYPTSFTKALAKALYKKADGIVFQTEDAKLFFPEKVQQKSRIILNQVDEKFFQENDYKGEYIIACGRLSNQKNYQMLINVFAEVLKDYPNEILRIYGEGVLKDELMQLTRDLKISNSVEFMGFSTDMVEVYRNAKFLVMTSDYEGMPNVMLEALASSVPVISTDCPCGGPRMIIKDGENGFLVKVGDCNQLKNKINYLLKNDKLIILLGKTARIMAEAYRGVHIIKDWENYITSIVRNKYCEK